MSAELEQATKAIIEKPIWYSFFKDFHPNWYFVTSKSIMHLEKENSFYINYTDTYTIDVNFPSIDDLKEYILLWFPYLAPLTEDQKSIFFSQVIESYCNFLPPKNDGSISMKIPVLSLIASKN